MIDLKLQVVNVGLVFAVIASAGCADPGVTSCSPVPAAGAYSAGPVTDGTSSQTAGRGSTTSAVSGSSDAGSADMEQDAPGPCPDGYMCSDLSSFGATGVDQNGKPVTHSCGMGAPVDCNDADPKSTCGALDNPICAHIQVAGMELVSCGQRCTP